MMHSHMPLFGFLNQTVNILKKYNYTTRKSDNLRRSFQLVRLVTQEVLYHHVGHKTDPSPMKNGPSNMAVKCYVVIVFVVEL